jgi:hypothetical protein
MSRNVAEIIALILGRPLFRTTITITDAGNSALSGAELTQPYTWSAIKRWLDSYYYGVACSWDYQYSV